MLQIAVDSLTVCPVGMGETIRRAAGRQVDRDAVILQIGQDGIDPAGDGDFQSPIEIEEDSLEVREVRSYHGRIVAATRAVVQNHCGLFVRRHVVYTMQLREPVGAIDRNEGAVGWRLHLSTQPVAAVHFVEDGAQTPQLAVWDSRHNVHFYDRRDGTPLGELKLADHRPPDDLNEPGWREIVDTLRAPNGRFLPAVYLNRATILQSWDGRLRLYHQHEGGLILEVEGRHIALDREQDGRYFVAGLDRALGLSCAYSDQGLLSVFQQHVRGGTFEVHLALDMDARLNLAVPEAMGRMLLCDG